MGAGASTLGGPGGPEIGKFALFNGPTTEPEYCFQPFSTPVGKEQPHGTGKNWWRRKRIHVGI